MLEVCNDNTAVDGVITFQTHTLTAIIHFHIVDGGVVDTKVDLVANRSGEAHGRGILLGDVVGEAACVMIVGLNKFKRVKKVG